MPFVKRTPPSDPPMQAAGAVNKVPQLTALFWIAKLLTTGGGEAASDYLLSTFNQIAVLGITIAVFTGVLTAQFRATRYIPWLYWLAVLMVAIFGTMLADITFVIFHVPYIATCSALAAVLAVMFTAWYRTQGTLSIHEINTRPREGFYWGAVVGTFAFGTALGDLTADFLPLVFLGSAVFFAVLIVSPGLAYRYLGLNSVLTFWVTYILTRPLGASIADWIAAPPLRDGLDVGKGPVALISIAAIAALVAYETRRGPSSPAAPTSRDTMSRTTA